jgi:hypothetical protein
MSSTDPVLTLLQAIRDDIDSEPPSAELAASLTLLEAALCCFELTH